MPKKNRTARRHPAAEPNIPQAARRRLWSMEETADQLNIHRTYLYPLIRSGDLTQVHIGRRAMITDESLSRFVAKLEDGAAAG
jgi:excisionase family DNA binding protein